MTGIFDAQFLNIAGRVHWAKMEIKEGMSSSVLFWKQPKPTFVMSSNKESERGITRSLKRLKFI